MKPQAAPRYYSLQELAARWNISDSTLRRWMREGELAVFRMGVKIRVAEAEVARMEAQWQSELDASRQAWNAKVAERKAAIE